MRNIDLTSDLDVLFGTVAGEAENQPLIGMRAVAMSVMNRVPIAKAGHKQFGDGTVRGACLAHEQYDCWMPGADRNRIMAIDLDNLSPAQQTCIVYAQQAIAGTLADPTSGATFYFEEHIAAPYWVPGMIWSGQFGTQLFWRNA